MSYMYVSSQDLSELIASLEIMRQECLDQFSGLRTKMAGVPESEFGSGDRSAFDALLDPIHRSLNQEFSQDSGPYAQLSENLKKLREIAIEMETVPLPSE